MADHDRIPWSDAALWYDANAAAFAHGAGQADMSHDIDLFTRGLPAGAAVLDVGCGTGRDAKIFLDRGFLTTGLDPSGAMCAIARTATDGRARICQARMETFETDETWDGIWMCASLLHVPKGPWAHIIARFAETLSPRGRLYISVKSGSGERIDARGRPMSYATCDDLRADLLAAGFDQNKITTYTSESAESSGHIVRWTIGVGRV